MRAMLSTLAALLALASSPVAAHPHGWIDMQSKLVLDEGGRAVAIEQAWLFDEFYSAFMLDEFEMNGQTQEEGLASLAHEDIRALAEFDYFTKVEVAGTSRSIARVKHYSNGVAAGRIWLRFRLPLAEPVAPEALRYAVYDPTYYIEILHVGDAPVQIEGEGAERCAPHLIEPKPSAEITSFAASLDRFTVADDGLGSHFAQWIKLECDEA